MNEYWQTFFDTDRERIGTGSSKWDNLGKLFDNPDAIPMWVADMDFPTAPAVTEALVKRAQHGLFGYNVAPATAKQAVCDWMLRRHGAHIEPDWIFSSPGVVDSIFHTLCALTGPDDPVLIQQPVYGPFRAMTVKSERPLVKSSLIETENGFEMDFDDLEQKFASGVKAMILCNPHNPVGRIWTKDELTRLLALCNRYGVLLLDDEIHLDFELDGKCTSLQTLSGVDNVVTFTASTKTFNLAGLKQSSVIIRNPELREKVLRRFDEVKVCGENIFGILAQTVAYETGDEYVDNLCEYLRGNRDYAEQFINEQLPFARCHHLEGTYLLWVDFTALQGRMTQDELKTFMSRTAGVAMSNGTDFGDGGELHMRVNLATQRANIVRGLNQMKAALEALA